MYLAMALIANGFANGGLVTMQNQMLPVELFKAVDRCSHFGVDAESAECQPLCGCVVYIHQPKAQTIQYGILYNLSTWGQSTFKRRYRSWIKTITVNRLWWKRTEEGPSSGWFWVPDVKRIDTPFDTGELFSELTSRWSCITLLDSWPWFFRRCRNGNANKYTFGDMAPYAVSENPINRKGIKGYGNLKTWIWKREP